MSKERRVPVHRSKAEPKPQYFSSNHCIPLLGSCLDMHAFGFSRVGKGRGSPANPTLRFQAGCAWSLACFGFEHVRPAASSGKLQWVQLPNHTASLQHPQQILALARDDILVKHRPRFKHSAACTLDYHGFVESDCGHCGIQNLIYAT